MTAKHFKNPRRRHKSQHFVAISVIVLLALVALPCLVKVYFSIGPELFCHALILREKIFCPKLDSNSTKANIKKKHYIVESFVFYNQP